MSSLPPNPMDSRAAELITLLDLAPHPEGGYFREIYRSPLTVQSPDQTGHRQALTTIYFLLPGGARSCWHRVKTADEVWHYYEGAPLELWMADRHWANPTRHLLGTVNLTEGIHPVQIVPANVWQGAQSTGSYTLVGCTVGPGFEFADFEMARDLPEAAIVQNNPMLAPFL